jgi:hypothetical protein
MRNINEILCDHVILDVACMDRIYLNGYAPKLQTSGQLLTLMIERLGKPIASPYGWKVARLFPDNRPHGQYKLFPHAGIRT